MIKSRKNEEIVFLIYSLSGGGAERVTCHMAEYWASLGKKVTVVTYGTSSNHGYRLAPTVNHIGLGIDFVSCGPLDAVRNNIRSMFAVRSCISSIAPDVVISMMAASNVLLAVSCVGLKSRLIGSERNYPGDDDTNKVWHWLRRYSYRFLDCVVAQTQDGADWLDENTFVKKSVSIPNPLVFPLPAGEPNLSPTIMKGRKLVLGVGRLAAQKQFDHLIRCFAAARAMHEDWSLVILGEGELHAELLQLVENLNLTGQIYLPGRVGNVSEWYVAADIFTLSSRTEGFPNALIEAMSYGAAPLSYDCKTGPREIILDGENGMLVTEGGEGEFADKLLELMSDSKLRSQLSREAKKIRQTLEISKVMGLWEELMG